jgi:hypothetical protein
MTAFPLPHSALERLVAELRGLMPEPGTTRKASTESSTFRRPERASVVAATTPGSTTGSEATATVTDPTMPGRTDEQLLVAYRNGDPAAFTALVERYRNDLIGFLQRFLARGPRRTTSFRTPSCRSTFRRRASTRPAASSRGSTPSPRTRPATSTVADAVAPP